MIRQFLLGIGFYTFWGNSKQAYLWDNPLVYQFYFSKYAPTILIYRNQALADYLTAFFNLIFNFFITTENKIKIFLWKIFL